LATGLKLDAPGTLQRRAWELAATFDSNATCRLAVVAKDEAEARSKLSAAAARISSGPFSTPDGVAYGQGAKLGKVAFLFPGQGSQLVEMGGEVAGLLDAAIVPWDVAAGVHMGAERLHDVVFPRPVFSDEDRAAQQDKLTRTEWAQPALGATSLALAEVLKALGVAPEMAAGHSFGELCALWTAGALSTEALLRAARRRGELMAEAAARPGAMSAVSASVEQVKAALAAHPDVVLANHNSPTQIVISGPTDAVEAAEKALGAAGLSFKRLKVATAFHSPVVADAVGPFGAFLADLEVNAPSLPVYMNATAAPYAADAAQVRQGLAAQLASPVRFVEQIVAMADAGAAIFVEVGPQAVLTGLVDSILGERPHLAVALDRKGKNGWTTLLSGVGRLAAAGVSRRRSGAVGGLRRAHRPRERQARGPDAAYQREQSRQALPARERRGGPARAQP
jgi:acyl transferase domain-containing protein